MTIQSQAIVEAATTSRAALEPYVDTDWSNRAGSLDWDIEHTIVHMLNTVAKYTLYVT
jgi:hypothetical protein